MNLTSAVATGRGHQPMVRVVTDGDNMIRLLPGAGASAEEAVNGARTPSAWAWHYADLLAAQQGLDLPHTHYATFGQPTPA